MPAILVSSLLAGLLVSLVDLQGVTSDELSPVVGYLLMIFIFIVSVDVGAGLDRRTVGQLGQDAVFLSAATSTGSLAVGLVLSPLLGLGLKATVATTLGMGWYTLDGPLVASYLGSVAGATAFFSNFIRELFTFVAYPFFRRRVGSRNAICLGGATTMDTTLTVVSAVSGPEVGAVSFLHGVILTLLVPFLVSFALTFIP
jgi:uncharacterized membrane protein YbjE (DUF340 family)